MVVRLFWRGEAESGRREMRRAARKEGRQLFMDIATLVKCRNIDKSCKNAATPSTRPLLTHKHRLVALSKGQNIASTSKSSGCLGIRFLRKR
jgi:hypothetical protein